MERLVHHEACLLLVQLCKLTSLSSEQIIARNEFQEVVQPRNLIHLLPRKNLQTYHYPQAGLNLLFLEHDSYRMDLCFAQCMPILAKRMDRSPMGQVLHLGQLLLLEMEWLDKLSLSLILSYY